MSSIATDMARAPYAGHWRLTSSQLASMQDLHEIEQFYRREARLQHNHAHREWLETMVDRDVHYWLPVFEVRFVRDRRPVATPDDPAVYNDTWDDLDFRIKRMETGMVWMEDPPTRIRHMITNVEAYHGALPGYFEVYSNVHVYRNRRQREETTLYGGREDVLRRTQDGSLRIYRRKIQLDQRVVLDKNLNFFM